MNKLYNWGILLFLSLPCLPVIAQTPCTDGFAGIYPCENVDLLAFVPLSEIGDGENTNDIWGWVSPNTGKEYALVGCSNGTAFLDLSDPTEPVYLGILPTHTINSLWRDLETYNNYCFIVSEASAHGLQVFDLLQLDEVTNAPVNFEESAHYDGFGHCHTLSIDTQSGFCYCNGTGTFEGGLHIVNIQDPLNPVLAGGFSQDGYTHDSFAWTYDGPDPDYQGRELVFACNEDELSIVDVTDKSDCDLIASYSYPDVGYVHQGWITKDKSYFLIDDELDEQDLGNEGIDTGTRTHIFEVIDLDDADYLGFYESTSPSIDHNLYILDQFVYESNYRSGLRVLDAVHVSDGELNDVGYFDLYPENDNAQFSGTWSNYPYLPSRINLATHMYQGIFILKPTLIELSQSQFDLCGNTEIVMEVEVKADIAFPVTFAVDGMTGVSVSADQMNAPGVVTVTISDLDALAPGTYHPDLALQTNFGEQYEVPFTVIKSDGIPAAPELLNVPDNSLVSNTAGSVIFEWLEDASATGYVFELAEDENFTSIVEVENLEINSFVLSYNLPDGTYYWRVRSDNECGTGPDSEVFSFQVTFVSIGEMEEGKISLFPNPASEYIILNGLENNSTVTLSDISGRVISTVNVPGTQLTLDVRNLAPGTYLVRANNQSLRWIRN